MLRMGRVLPVFRHGLRWVRPHAISYAQRHRRAGRLLRCRFVAGSRPRPQAPGIAAAAAGAAAAAAGAAAAPFWMAPVIAGKSNPLSRSSAWPAPSDCAALLRSPSRPAGAAGAPRPRDGSPPRIGIAAGDRVESGGICDGDLTGARQAEARAWRRQSTETRGASQPRCRQTWRGQTWRRQARGGEPWRGQARRGETRSAVRPGAVRPGVVSPVVVRPGVLRAGLVRPGAVRPGCGEARRRERTGERAGQRGRRRHSATRQARSAG